MKKAFYILFTISFPFLLPIKLQAQAWTELGGNGFNGSIFSMCSDAFGNIYAAGAFTDSIGNNYVAKWNGTAWSELGGSNRLAANNYILSVCTDTSGNIYAAGQFTNNSDNYYVAKWNGTAWSELGGLNGLSANNYILSVCSPAAAGGNIYAAGEFTNDSDNYYVAKWNGTAWSELGGLNSLAANGEIYSLCSDGTGNIYAAGFFTNDTGGYYIGKYNGTAWGELNDLEPTTFIFSDAKGNIYATGLYANDSARYYVAEYSRTAWSELGGANSLAANHEIYAICSDTSGNIYAAGAFTDDSARKYVAGYNWTAWSELGGLNGLAANNTIKSICSDGAGNIYAAGEFTNASGKYYVARYAPGAAGINEIGSANLIKVFPNPACNTITISSGYILSNATIRLLSITGQAVIEENNQSGDKFTLDISNQPPGLYFVQVREQENVWIGKVVKSN